MSSILTRSLTTVLLLSCGQLVVADSLTLDASRDATLCEEASGALANGSGAHLFTGSNNEPSLRRTLIAVDIAAAVPSGSTIDAVTLTLNLSRAASDPSDVDVHRVLADWGEGGSDPDGSEGRCVVSETGDTTWIHRVQPGQLWAQPGGDFVPAISASQLVGVLGPHSWSSPELAADVQAWLDDPASNHGWMLRGDEATPGSAKRFDSRDNPGPGVRPSLLVVFTPAPGVTVYESTDPASLGTAVGTATASPFPYAPPTGEPRLYYQLDDGSGFPTLIRLVKGGAGILIHYQ